MALTARSSAAALRLAALLEEVASGLSLEQATLAVRVSKRTVWLRRRRDPEFAAALHEALLLSRDIQAAARDARFRRQLLALAVEADERGQLSDGRNSRRIKRLLYRWHGRWPVGELPGCSPSHDVEHADPLVRLMRNATRDAMRASFERRRRIKAVRARVAPHADAEIARLNALDE